MKVQSRIHLRSTITRKKTFIEQYDFFQSNENFLVQEQSGKELERTYNYMKTLPEIGEIIQQLESAGISLPTHQINHLCKFEHGYLLFITYEPVPEAHELFMRFTKVFEQTYTRFLDLQKAEAQAREAQIEAALEKVRSRTMGMQKSEELPEVAHVLFLQIQSLVIPTWSAGYNILSEDQKSSTCIMSSEGQIQSAFHLPLTGEKSFQEWHDAIHQTEPFFVQELGGNELEAHYQYLRSLPDIQQAIDPLEEAGISFPTYQINHLSFFQQGFLLFITYEKVPEAHEIFKRFTQVFEQTYTRFLDLQKAEAQAREAKIEAALERVRARTMAMQRSDELAEVSYLLNNQVRALGTKTWGCAFNIYGENDSTEWFGTEAGTMPTYKTPREGIFLKYYEKGQAGETFYIEAFDGQKQIDHYDYMCTLPGVGDILNQIKASGHSFPPSQIDHIAYFKYGYLLFITLEPAPELHEIFRRFAVVFEQTYTRFLDLQRAEAQTKEALRQSSLDRVRGEIASMRTTQDLERITPLIWQELNTLEVPFFRCGVFIVDADNKKVDSYLSNPQGESLAAWRSEYHTTPLFAAAVKSWEKQEVYRTEWNKKQFIEFTQILIDQGLVEDQQRYQAGNESPDHLVLQMIPFTQGLLYVGSDLTLNDEQIDLVKALADAFAVAYARYEDFNKLESTNAELGKTLDNLKSTQNQLIQSEKMASLGELTAGIAHEIQNPLNFVNNFSEVSGELIEEIKEELEDGNVEEVVEIMEDLKQNLEKINHHGHRASGIVKGMLDHSRASSGERVMTDINQLADEYLRLAYHGLRAKDRSFNATFEVNFDKNLPKVEVATQDISRVFLNLINNAFHACTEKSKKTKNGYIPKITLTTTYENGYIKISIKDNGTGIPNDIKDKIFQPFYTTKPTGQGTGLGLSLSYDIIKAHGGEIEVGSKVGKGTQFTILLPVEF